jgi:hypothetical protein
MDGAALLAAAVRAAVQAKAPRRTVQAVAAAVTGVLLRLPADAVPHPDSRRQPDAPVQTADAGDPVQLLASLRAARRSQRQRKKERRRLAKQATSALPSSPPHDHQPVAGDVVAAGAAGPRAELGAVLAAAPAQTPERPELSTLGLPLMTLLPAPAAVSPADSSAGGSSVRTMHPADSDVDAGSSRGALAAARSSAGMPHPARSAPYRRRPGQH